MKMLAFASKGHPLPAATAILHAFEPPMKGAGLLAAEADWQAARAASIAIAAELGDACAKNRESELAGLAPHIAMLERKQSAAAAEEARLQRIVEKLSEPWRRACAEALRDAIDPLRESLAVQIAEFCGVAETLIALGRFATGNKIDAPWLAQDGARAMFSLSRALNQVVEFAGPRAAD